ncbi:MAG: phage tail protein [Candidatus Methanoperedenaceae archaeon]|nr:MAG: phage tail protein [Candidatus Methanoperedenaceae archaeon]
MADKLQRKDDPYKTFNYIVEIEGITVGGFSEVSGMRIETETYPIKEGGLNSFIHMLPKSSKFSDITLKRGITDRILYDWYMDVVYGIIKRKSGSIILQDIGKVEQRTWYFFEAFPIKWEGSTLGASTSSVATETLVLTHHGLY